MLKEAIFCYIATNHLCYCFLKRVYICIFSFLKDTYFIKLVLVTSPNSNISKIDMETLLDKSK